VESSSVNDVLAAAIKIGSSVQHFSQQKIAAPYKIARACALELFELKRVDSSFALCLPCFGPTFCFVISSECPIALQLAFQSDRLMPFENQSGGEFSVAPFSVLNGSGSGVSGFNSAGESLPIC
jgi:hypothetical protein